MAARPLGVVHQVGNVLKDQGTLPEALNAYRDSLAIAERLAKADPGNAGWQADLAASHGKLGQLYVRMGNKAEARRMFGAPSLRRSPKDQGIRVGSGI